jgi:glycine/D-amino acid oxidase-like deaminating enzyme
MTDRIFAPDFKDRPWWWEAAEPVPAAAPPLPERAEVAIVGGGYCGMNCALELARRGRRAVVIEAERIGFGASSRNGGMVSGGLKLATGDLAAEHGEERARAIVEESARSLPFLEELIRREGIDCDWARSGRFLGAWNDRHYRELAGQVEKIRTLTGMGAAMVPRERQREEIGSDFYRGGMVAEAYGSLHPAKYARGLADAVRRAGATLVDGTRVTAVARAGEGFRVATSRGSLRADAVFMATNGYTPRDAAPWLARRVIPLASYIIATEELDPGLIRRLVPRGRMISDTKRVLNYYRISPDGRRVLFGGRASFRAQEARAVVPRMHAMMAAVWPELARARITHAWTGFVAFTFDHLPHLGAHESVHYAAGCQGSGVAMMSWLGHQAGLKLAGGANRASAFDGLAFPTRPFYDGRPWFLPAVGAWYRLRDRLDRRAG